MSRELARKDVATDPTRVRHIVVATDLTEDARAVLDAAVAFGRVFDASIDLVHVREPLVYTLTEGFVPAEEPRGEVNARIDEKLAALADYVTHAGVPCVTSSLDGLPHLEIARHAHSTHADLIVVGTRSRGGLAHAVLGSVAERITQRAACPVLVVPTEAHSRGGRTT